MESQPAYPSGAVTFWLGRLHHHRLHERARHRPALDVACPGCDMHYFVEDDNGQAQEYLRRRGEAYLARECPDHSSQFTISAMRSPAG